jgi:hypothetical protein
MKISICITYFYNRNNIYNLLNEINKYNKSKEDLEVLIRNDNPKITLSIKKKYNFNIFIYNEKKESVGEVKSLKFLLNKSKGDIVTFIADDDIISSKCFNFINNFPNENSYIFLASRNKKDIGKKSYLQVRNYNEAYKLFLKRKLFLCGTVGYFFSRNFIIKNYNKIFTKKYLFDFNILILQLFSKHKYFNFIGGYNDFSTSQISSQAINLNCFFLDLKKTFYLLNYCDNNLKYLTLNFLAEDFYSIFTRKEYKLNKILVFLKLFLRQHIGLRRVFLFIRLNYFVFKILLKKFSFKQL